MQLARALVKRLERYAAAEEQDHIDLLTWTILNRQWIDTRTRFDLEGHLYLADIYACSAQEMCVYKAAQLGISELFVSYDLHGCGVRGMTILHLMPTEGDVGDFSRQRFGGAIEASESVAGLIRDASGTQRGSDKVTLKRVGDGWLYLRGAQVDTKKKEARQLHAVAADAVVFDEYDRMSPWVRDIALKRLGHSKIAEVRYGSTPTWAGQGIVTIWADSDQREWFVPCEHCGHSAYIYIDKKDDCHHMVLEWDDLGRPRTWYGQNEKRAYIACGKCGREINHTAPGEWVARHPGRSLVGFHPTKLHTNQIPLLKVITDLQSVDETGQRQAWNQHLGLAYSPRGGKLTEEILDECRREYAHGPRGDDRPVAGIDVGKVLHLTIRSGSVNPDTGEWHQWFAGEVSWDDAIHLLKMYRVRRCVIDALPETTKAQELQAKFDKGVVWLCYYNLSDAGNKRLEPFVWDEVDGIVSCDRTRVMDRMFAGFYDGTSTLPLNIRDTASYYDQMTAPTRKQVTRDNGIQVSIYDEGENPDHYAHSETYCYIAMNAPAGVVAAAPVVVHRSQVLGDDEMRQRSSGIGVHRLNME